MRYQSILGLASATAVLFISVTGFDMPKLPGGGATDAIKAFPTPDVPVPPLLVTSLGNAVYLFEVGRQTPERDTKVTDKMDEIFKRLKVAALADEKYRVVAKELEEKWKLNTLRVKDPSTPAGAFPGGGIALYTGSFKDIKYEEVLASILGHEMAHLLSKHHLQRWNRAAVTALMEIEPKITSGEPLDKMDPKVLGPVLGAMGIGYIVGEDFPLERGKELEADCSGLVLAAKAGYDPTESEKFLHNEAMTNKQNPGDMSKLFKLHPPAKDRHSHISKTCLSEAQAAFNHVNGGKPKMDPVLLPDVKMS
jgi:metalloendopeptidase OMA1, mitochondrial